MRKTGRLAFVFLLLFMLATLETAFHHHDNDSDHHDCPVCAAGHHFSSATVNSYCLTIHQRVSNYEIPKETFLYDGIRLTLVNSRAPPA
jgi:hypothetical protein